MTSRGVFASFNHWIWPSWSLYGVVAQMRGIPVETSSVLSTFGNCRALGGGGGAALAGEQKKRRLS